MYRPSDKLVKLPRLASLPTIDDITGMLAQSRQTPGKQFELPWQFYNSSDIYRLIATCSQNVSEPTWNLMIGEGRDEIEVWTYQTGDVALVLNLVLSESTENMSYGTDSQSLFGQSETRNTGLSGSYSTSLLGLQSLTSTSQKVPVFRQDERVGIQASMEGSLDDWPIPTLLQSINMGKRSGKLMVISDQSMAELFFVSGDLVHATALSQQGELAIMELVTWETGKFYFYNDESTEQRTVKRRIDAILMESITLLDQTKYLMGQGFKMEAYLHRANAGLSEQQFEEAVKKGAPCDTNLQKQFYLRLDGNTTMFDILRERPMTKKEWVPILFNMFQCGLVKISESPLKPDKTKHLISTHLDRNAINSVMASLLRADTCLFSFSSFQYFLEKEFYRAQYANLPFTVIVFDLWTNRGGQLEPLTVTQVAEVGLRLANIMRPIDIAAHFETLSYAIILPNTEIPSAVILCHRVFELLRSKGLSAGMDPSSLVCAFGIAGVPEDCKDIGLLLSAAKVARKVAATSAMPIVCFKDLKAPSE
ncbi:DUF4388 domain-containing protein [bacterium]|nr:DUF4388 domain-containing protein [bacterium]